ncbi:molecular chaperone DnaK [Candidatus Sumerlaeota bacterium]|nr:molecular chaperone DnaK [Candidatus Sumerlaeota bacterium]
MSGFERIIGIDLGTTNSVMAIIEGDTPHIIPNAEGENRTPSVVSFLPTGETVVGEIARRQAATNVAGTVFSIKRLMGRSLDELDDDLDFFACPLVDREGQVALRLGDQTLTPPDISALILAKLKRDAEAQLGEEVSKAIVTVPAFFDDRQRQATMEAGRRAGLEILRIINEPTAAAMAYGLRRGKEERIAVFDFGGGTFDLSILDISEGAFEVITSLGDSRLGGDDIDHAIVDLMIEQFERAQGIDLGEDNLAIRRLKEAAEKAKCELSVTNSTLISQPFITRGPDGTPLHLEMTLRRQQVEDLTAPLVQRCLDCCAQALSDVGLTVRDIRRVILVGGSTRIPLVQAAVEDFFGLTPDHGVNPDEIVALGAATQGGVMSGALEEVVLLEVTPFALGIETKGDKISRIIEKNATIPIKAAKVFTTTEDEQSLVNIHVVQGEAESAREAVSLGKFSLTDIPLARAGTPRIRVTFQITADGVVEIEAEDLGSGQAQSLQIIHTFDRGQRAEMRGDSPEERKRRPNRWRERRRRVMGLEETPVPVPAETPLNAPLPRTGLDDVSVSHDPSGNVDFTASARARQQALEREAETTVPEGEAAEAVLAKAREHLAHRDESNEALSAYRAAIPVLDRRLETDESRPEDLRLLGQCHLMTHNLDRARASFQQHLQEHPDEMTQLRDCFDHMVSLHPHSVEARSDKARLLALMGEIDAALETLESLGDTGGRSATVNEQMIGLLKRRLACQEDSATEFKLVKLHLQQNDLDEAIAILQRLVNHESYAERAGKVLGLCFWQKHMHYLAWQRFRQLTLTEEIKDILYRLSLDMEAAEDHQGARQVLEHLAAGDRGYRDVAERLETSRDRLHSAQTLNTGAPDTPFGMIATPESQIDDVRFTILGEINRGSMGVIYKAKDNVLDEIVAIKVLNAFLAADPNAVDRFKREARAAKRLSHPNIVRIHDMFEKGNKKFLSMEFIDGSDLKSILKTQRRMAPAEVIRIVGEICLALAYAHRLEIIHRDIKPANIMITQRTRAVKITDFGIAKCLDATDRSATGTMVMGTPLYMAPEQVEGKPVDARTDLYSLGVLMYELISGKPPFTDGNIEYQHVHTDPNPPDHCPEGLSEVIMHCLRKVPSERFLSSEELLAQLKGLALANLETPESSIADTPVPTHAGQKTVPLKPDTPKPDTDFPKA